MKINGNFCLRKILGENILVQTDKHENTPEGIFIFDEVGAFIWEHTARADSAEDLARMLTEEYEVTYEQALNDVNEFLANLRKNKLIAE